MFIFFLSNLTLCFFALLYAAFLLFFQFSFVVFMLFSLSSRNSICRYWTSESWRARSLFNIVWRNTLFRISISRISVWRVNIFNFNFLLFLMRFFNRYDSFFKIFCFMKSFIKWFLSPFLLIYCFYSFLFGFIKFLVGINGCNSILRFKFLCFRRSRLKFFQCFLNLFTSLV